MNKDSLNLDTAKIEIKQIFTLTWYVRIRMFQVLERLFGNASALTKIDLGQNYFFVQSLRSSTDVNLTGVSLYRKSDKKYVVVKSCISRFPGVQQWLLRYEAIVLDLVNKLHRRLNNKKHLRDVRFPRMYSYETSENVAVLKTEYVKGCHADDLDARQQHDVLKKMLKFLETLNEKLTSDQLLISLPKKPTWTLVLVLPFHLILAAIKNYRYTVILLHLAFQFCRNIQLLWSDNTLSLAHRDIHPKNIIINNKEIVLIDPAICVLAHPLTDLAIVIRNFYSTLGYAKMNSLLESFVKTETELRIVQVLSIYYVFEYLSMASSHTFLKQSILDYAVFLHDQLQSSKVNQKAF